MKPVRVGTRISLFSTRQAGARDIGEEKAFARTTAYRAPVLSADETLTFTFPPISRFARSVDPDGPTVDVSNASPGDRAN